MNNNPIDLSSRQVQIMEDVAYVGWACEETMKACNIEELQLKSLSNEQSQALKREMIRIMMINGTNPVRIKRLLPECSLEEIETAWNQYGSKGMIMKTGKHNYIHDEIEIDFTLPTALKNMIELLEKADDEEDYGTYLSYADFLDTVAKNCCASGSISEKNWYTLLAKYVL